VIAVLAGVEPPAESVGAVWAILGFLARIATFCLVGAIIVTAAGMFFAWRAEEETRAWQRLIVIFAACLVLVNAGSIVTALF
jgi:uncharacterized membrane protein YphA (DoxX/SURF4 family)